MAFSFVLSAKKALPMIEVIKGRESRLGQGRLTSSDKPIQRVRLSKN